MQCTTSKAGKGQKAGSAPLYDQSQPPAGPESSNACTPLDQWTPPPKEHTTTHTHTIFQKYISISPLSVSENPEETPKHTKNSFTFAPFWPDSMPFWPGGVVEDSGSRGEWKPAWYIESRQKEPPPPIGGATRAFYPHNFSHRKYRKKFAQEDIVFRTKNTAKSQPTFGWKKFRKFFYGRMFRVKERPQSWRRGGEVLKYERLVSCAKIVELFWNARG